MPSVKTGLRVVIEVIRRTFGKTLAIEDTESSLQRLGETKGSISRFGDGEFNIMCGGCEGFQSYDAELASRLKEVLRSAGENEPAHFVGIPIAMRSLKGFTKRSGKFWVIYCAQNRREVVALLKPSAHYLDSQISRFYLNRKSQSQSRLFLKLWREIWENKRILIVEGEKTRFGVGNDLFDNAQLVSRVLCPAENAWNFYDSIFEAVKQIAPDYDIVLLVLGPTATVLAYDLARAGLRAIDIGNMDMEYEWYRRGVDCQIAICGKYTLEAEGGMEVESVYDEKYLSEIVLRMEG